MTIEEDVSLAAALVYLLFSDGGDPKDDADRRHGLHVAYH
jgi:hypothetical protein